MTAEGLTEAERTLVRYTDEPRGYLYVSDVERILADRLAAVQAERAAAEQERDDWRWSAQGLAARAESAEAERDALRERVEALADECANSSCIHLNDLYGRLHTALDADRSTDPSAGSERA